MPNSIERDVYVLRDTLKNPISYVRGTDLLPIILHFRDFTIPSGATAKVFVAKNDGNAVYGGATITGNDVTVDVTQQMFITLGVNLMQVEIDSGNETLVTFEQPVMVTPNLKAGDLPDSATDVDFIDKIIEQAQEAVNDANAALETANTAISGANTAAESANSAAQNANNAAEELQDKVDAGDFTASVQVGTTTTLNPGQDATVSNSGTNKDAVLDFGIPKGDPGTAASIQVGTTQTVQPEENAEVTNTGTTSAAVLNFKIPRGKDGMTDLTAEYTDASEYTCQPTVNAPVVVKELDGKTEQGENPSPNNPQVIKGVGGMGYFDGEWRQGLYQSTDGNFSNSSYGICSQNYIPCKKNDVIKMEYGEIVPYLIIVFYNSNKNYISSRISTKNINKLQAIAPESAAYFMIDVQYPNNSIITPSTAKYCTVTINGKYQTVVEVTGKNLAEVTLAPGTYTGSGVTMNLRPDGSYTLNGTAPNTSIFRLNQPQGDDVDSFPTICILKQGKKYRLSCCQLSLRNASKPNGATSTVNAMNNDIIYTPTEDTEIIGIRAHYKNGKTYNSSKVYYPGIWEDESETDTEWQPFKRTSLSIPLTSPLYSGDKICYVKPGESYVDADGTTVVADRILYGVYRENAEVVFDGSEDEQWIYFNDNCNQFYIEINDVIHDGNVPNAMCNFFASGIVSERETKDNIIYTISDPLGIGINTYSQSSLVNWKTWLQSNPLTVLYKLAQPYFEPFTDQSIFYGLRTDDALSYVYSNDPIEPNVTVEVAKNDTGGILLESYTTAQKNALAEADNASRLASVEQQLLTLNTTVSTMGGGQ